MLNIPKTTIYQQKSFKVKNQTQSNQNPTGEYKLLYNWDKLFYLLSSHY